MKKGELFFNYVVDFPVYGGEDERFSFRSEFSSKTLKDSDEAIRHALELDNFKVMSDDFVTSEDGGVCVQCYASRRGSRGEWFELTTDNGYDLLWSFIRGSDVQRNSKEYY